MQAQGYRRGVDELIVLIDNNFIIHDFHLEEDLFCIIIAGTVPLKTIIGLSRSTIGVPLQLFSCSVKYSH